MAKVTEAFYKRTELVKVKGDPGEPRFTKLSRASYKEANGNKEKAVEILMAKDPNLSPEIARVYVEFTHFEQNREKILATL